MKSFPKRADDRAIVILCGLPTGNGPRTTDAAIWIGPAIHTNAIIERLKTDSMIGTALELPAYRGWPAETYTRTVTKAELETTRNEGRHSQTWEQFAGKKNARKKSIEVVETIPAAPPGPKPEFIVHEANGHTLHYVNQVAAAIAERLKQHAPAIDGPWHERVIFRAMELAEDMAARIEPKRQEPAGDERPADEPPATKCKEPSKNDFKIYQTNLLYGRNFGGNSSQEEIAVLVTNNGIPCDQTKVSRATRNVKAWLKAGNMLPDIESANVKLSTVYVAPDVLDMGERSDGRALRQRQKHNSTHE